jgi:hypothetical protein
VGSLTKLNSIYPFIIADKNVALKNITVNIHYCHGDREICWPNYKIFYVPLVAGRIKNFEQLSACLH